jgi:hypothetical protein
MNNKTAQTEKEQYPVYLDIKRNWHAREIRAEDWEFDYFDFTGNKVFFLKDGRIGMEYGGRVIVRTVEHWMSSAEVRTMPTPEPELHLE